MTAAKVLDWKPRRGQPVIVNTGGDDAHGYVAALKHPNPALRGDVCVVFGNGVEMWISVRHLRPDTDDLGDV